MNTLLSLSLPAAMGFLIGGIINLISKKLPKYLFHCWQQHGPATAEDPFNYRVHGYCNPCHCRHRAWRHLSFLQFLLGRVQCMHCLQFIDFRGLVIESTTAMLSLLVINNFGYCLHAYALLIFCYTLLLLAVIDFYHYLLPDCIVYPLLWLGLLLNCHHLFTSPESAIIGASSGYLGLWSTNFLFQLVRKKPGIGQGDMKLLAALGAWLGADSLLFIVLIACSLGATIGLLQTLRHKQNYNQPLPFAPFLTFAGLVVCLGQ